MIRQIVKLYLKNGLASLGLELRKTKNAAHQKVLNNLQHRFWDYPGYQPVDLDLAGYRVSASNLSSTLQMYEDIFVAESGAVQFSKADPLIYDLGANIGLCSLYYKQKYPQARIKAFEAHPDVYRFLAKNIAQNELKHIEAFNEAIADKDGELSFHCDPGGQTSSIHKPLSINTNEQKVPAARLKELIEAEEGDIDLIKMDIEGIETAVLKDCKDSLSRVQRMIIEYHSSRKEPQNLAIILDILEKAGFRYMIKENSFADFNLKDLDKNSSHFDTIIHIEAIKESLLYSK